MVVLSPVHPVAHVLPVGGVLGPLMLDHLLQGIKMLLQEPQDPKDAPSSKRGRRSREEG